jgi:hypothetical protein
LEDYSLEELQKIIVLLWETIPEKIIRRIRKHIKETSPKKLKDELNSSDVFSTLFSISQNYEISIWWSVLWDIAKEEIMGALEKEKQPAYGIILRDWRIGLYKIILRQNPAPCGYMQIRWGDYSVQYGDSEKFVNLLQSPNEKIIELEDDLCEQWLLKLEDFRKTGLTRSRRFRGAAYNFAVYTSDSNWSLESFEYHHAFSKKDWDIAWKNRIEELVIYIINRAELEMPLWKRRSFINNIALIPDKYSIQKGQFEIYFSPSFQKHLTVLIKSSEDESKLIARYGSNNEEYEISKEVANNFLKAINYLSTGERAEDEGLMLDGIGISGVFSAGSNIGFRFGFRSPEKPESPKEYGIVEAVFYVFNSIKLSQSFKNYLEELSRYFIDWGPYNSIKI